MANQSAQDQSCLVLSGGGARGAFQAGVMRAIYELAAKKNQLRVFRTLAGVSAGAINVSHLAAGVEDLDSTTKELCEVWRNIRAEDVFETDYGSVTKNALKLVRGVSLGGLSSRLRPLTVGLLNTNPLRNLLLKSISFDKIRSNISAGRLNAVAISATDYSTSLGVTFVESAQSFPMWKSANRISLEAKINVDHVMASSSIPIFFPPWPIEERHFGDGCLRNMAPLSPAIHMGAKNMLIVGVRRRTEMDLTSGKVLQPSLGRVLSVLINSIFMDAVEIDLERLTIINQTVEQMKSAGLETRYQPIRALYIHPSKSLAALAQSREDDLPKIIRFLLQGLGTSEETAELLSYLLFEPGYCSTLVDLGYKDAMDRRTEIETFLDLSEAAPDPI